MNLLNLVFPSCQGSEMPPPTLIASSLPHRLSLILHEVLSDHLTMPPGGTGATGLAGGVHTTADFFAVLDMDSFQV